jgi:hypothetical protein
VNWKAKQLFKEKTLVPQLEKEGFCVAIRAENLVINPQEIQESIQRYQESPAQEHFGTKKSHIQTEVDLHIERLHDFPEELSNEEMFLLQIRTFEEKLDRAIQEGNEGITFIHGVGNGRLRHEIQKVVSGHPHIQYFKDAQKERFGYGATYVKIK